MGSPIGIPYQFIKTSDSPEDDFVAPNVVYVNENDKMIILKCPCGCGDIITLGIRLNETNHPSWIPIIETKSITPSIQRTYGCKSHFTITNGITI